MSLIKLSLIFAGILLLLAVAGAVGFTLVSNGHKSKIIELQNEVAKRDVTIEVQKDVYTKLALQTNSMKELLDSTDAELLRLNSELRDRKAEVLAAQKLTIKWKKDFEALVVAIQTEQDGVTPDAPTRKKVSFSKDFGYILAEGYTLTDPPEAFVRVKQNRPLRLSVVMTQDPDRSWRGYATSSEEDMLVEIGVSAVNPQLLDPKWYEKISLHGDIGIGNGVLLGLGASYKIGKFTVGPSVWGTMGLELQPKAYVGITMGVSPFERN